MTDNNEDKVRTIAGEIVASYLSNNQMAAEQVPGFIKQVMTALETEKEAAPPEEPQKPAVSVRRSVRNDAVVCLECGAVQKTLKRHISIAHGLSEKEYREKWGLSKEHPLVAPSYSKARAEMAKKIGLGQKRPARRKAARKSS